MVKVVSACGNQKAKSGGMGRVFRKICGQSPHKIGTSGVLSVARRCIFCYDDSVPDPPTLIPTESYDSQLSTCVISLGC